MCSDECFMYANKLGKPTLPVSKRWFVYILCVFITGYYSAFIYGYNILQCPMEIIHGRQSALHNVASGGLIGYIGVTRGNMGVPFVSPYFLYGTRHPGLIGAAVVSNHEMYFVPSVFLFYSDLLDAS